MPHNLIFLSPSRTAHFFPRKSYLRWFLSCCFGFGQMWILRAFFAPRLFLIAVLFCVSFLQEADAVVSVLGEMDAWIICPFFLQGGRYTINDVHYVADFDR